MMFPGGDLNVLAILMAAAMAAAAWLLLSIAAAIYAARIGRTGVGWFLVSLILSPLIAAAFLLALGRHDAFFCPHCAEPIREEATRCPHCQGEVVEDDQAPHPLNQRWDDRRRYDRR